MQTKPSVTRRRFTQQSAVLLVAGTLPIAGCSKDDSITYQQLVDDTWRHRQRSLEQAQLLQTLVHYATLAPNSHNTQPWLFQLDTHRIRISPDFNRRCPAVDPDDHHLYISLGCAAENLMLAAEAFGLRPNLSIDTSQEALIQIDWEPVTETVSSNSSATSHLFQAIPKRQCTRADYDGKPLSSMQLAALESLSLEEGVAVKLFTERQALDAISDYVIAGNTAQINDPAFVRELKDWIRFNESTATRSRDGLFTASTGNPSLPTWLGNIMFKLAFRADSENDKYRRQIRSSAGVAAFISERNDPRSWIKVGRSYQRFALQAAAFGVRHAHINQAIEVPKVRAEFADYLGIENRRPDLLVRFGYGPEMPRSLRRPIDQVIV